MAFVDVPGILVYPSEFLNGSNSAGTINTLTIDASAEKVAFIVIAPEDGVIDKVTFRMVTVTQAPANGLRVSLQDVSGTDGNADGVQDQYRVVPQGSITANTWITTGLLTSDGTDTGTKRTVAKGDHIAVVIEFESFSASDSLGIGSNILGPVPTPSRSNIYNALFTASWAKQTPAGYLALAIQYSAGSEWIRFPGCTASVFGTSSAVNNSEVGVKFTLPVPMRVTGLYGHFSAAATNGTYQAYLYDANDVELASSPVYDPEICNVPGNAGTRYLPFSNTAESVELDANTTYRAVIRGTGSSNVAVATITPFDSTAVSSQPWWGTGAVLTTRPAAGSWTDSATGVSAGIGLEISAIDPVKSASSITSQIMNVAALFGGRFRKRQFD